jgi:protein TonB
VLYCREKFTVTVNFTLATGGVGAPVNSGAVQPIATFSPSSADPVYLNGREVVRIGGDVKAPERTRYVVPVYPPDAKAARVSGVVIIEAMIDETGHVAQAKVVRSILSLDQAAVDAVLQWEYTPTLLNGVAVPVLMTVTVNFTLQ